MNKIIIGDVLFRNKKLAKTYVQEIINKYNIGERVSEADAVFLTNLVSLHPEADSKIGYGIDFFSISEDPVWKKTRHFVINRKDGSSTDFSFHTCIDGKSRRKDVLEACRWAVAEEIILFKVTSFKKGKVSCPIRKIELEKDDCHVDHKAPMTFAKLFSDWLRTSGFNIEDIKISPSADNQWQTQMINKDQMLSWKSFHSKNAVLRIVSKLANLSDLKFGATYRNQN